MYQHTSSALRRLNVIGRAAFLHDFEGGKSSDAKQILNARRRGVSPAAKYAGFLVSTRISSALVSNGPSYYQTLMLLRRFPILNRLPINAIQSQGLAKLTIQVSYSRQRPVILCSMVIFSVRSRTRAGEEEPGHRQFERRYSEDREGSTQ